MLWILENLDRIVQLVTLATLLGAGALLKAISNKISQIAALPSTVDNLTKSVSVLSEKLQQMDVDVKEAIGVKRHISEILSRLSTLEGIVTK